MDDLVPMNQPERDVVKVEQEVDEDEDESESESEDGGK